MDTLPPFPGFRPEAFQFLRDLKANNERDWFKPRKQTFDDECLWPLRCLVEDAGRAATTVGIPLRGDATKSVFRIYRDTRFSKNKDPYKTHLGAVLSRSGSRKASGGLYIHVEPDNCFTVAGFWQPDKDLLAAIRDDIVAEPDRFRGMMNALGGLELMEYGGMLKRLPRGYQTDDEDIGEAIRHKSFIVTQSFQEEELMAPEFTGRLIEAAGSMRSILDWGWHIQDRLNGGPQG
ncbi:MAG: DUF2461 domain-containing protein [Rhodothermales bacterium]|nr:DUF2461 domain-containing protein [Rhodothermales bacterium]MBO6781376.1 DUF2461 domain-containing protein [Rhodothermales bacterium]